jgi:hypothetical protein
MASADPLAATRRSGPPTGWVIGAVVAAVALIVGVVAVVSTDDNRSADGGDLAFVEIPTDGGREAAVGAGAVWVANDANDVVLRIDPASGEVTDEIPIEQARGIAATDDAVWVGADGVGLGDPDTLTRIDPATNEIVAEVPLPAETAVDGVTADPNGAWVVTDEPQLVHINGATNDVVSETPIDGEFPDIAVGDDALWVSPNGAEPAQIERLDRASGQTTTTDLSIDDRVSSDQSISLGPVAAAGGTFWVVRERSSFEPLSFGVDLCRVDSGSEDYACAGFNPLDDISSISFGEGALWAITLRDEAFLVLRIDPDTLEVTAELDLPAEGLFDIAAGEGAAWATNETSETLGTSAVFKISA